MCSFFTPSNLCSTVREFGLLCNTAHSVLTCSIVVLGLRCVPVPGKAGPPQVRQTPMGPMWNKLFGYSESDMITLLTGDRDL
jgi:hypothetical protein